MSKRKRENKLMGAAHIKRNTAGTSNEISFSVLDAATNQLDVSTGDKRTGLLRFGHVSLFTLPLGGKKPAPTPAKEQGLPLSSGDFVSVQNSTAELGRGLIERGSLGSSVSSDSLAGALAPSGSAGFSSGQSPAAGQTIPSHPSPARSSGLSFADSARSAEEKIRSRKRRRRRHRRLAVAFVAVVTTAAIAAGGTYLYQDNQRHLSQVGQLDDALALIEDTDDMFVSLDEAVNNPFETDADEAYQEVTSQIAESSDSLEKAASLLQPLSSDMHESMDKEAVRQALAAVSARQTLANEGVQMLDQASVAREAAARLEEAWQQVISADALAREAAQLVTDTTDEHVNESKAKTDQATTAFETARDGLEEAGALYPDADLELLVSYVDKRIESLGYAAASDEAFLMKDKETATAQNDAYNTADAEAAALAKKIPTDPAELVHEAYSQAVSESSQAYSTARLQAGTADAFIRDYLGAGFK